MIKPTVGRCLWFYPLGANQAPHAAIIAHVWSDTCVNIAYFEASGRPAMDPPTSIRILQEGDEVPTNGLYCTWMPYQKGQAAKTEELEKQLDKTDQETPTLPQG